MKIACSPADLEDSKLYAVNEEMHLTIQASQPQTHIQMEEESIAHHSKSVIIVHRALIPCSFHFSEQSQSRSL